MFNFPRHFERTAGGWVALWHRWRTRRVAGDLAIPEQALEPAVLHADATGGRVQGPTHGVGCFPAPDRTFYRLDRCRGSPALTRVFKTGCAGTLVSDVWGASHAGVCAPHQTCLPHRRRDRKRTEPSHPPGGDWPTFATLLKRVIRDAIRLSPRRRDLPAERFAARPCRRERRWDEVRAQPWEDRHVRRWVQRRRRHRSELVTVLDGFDLGLM